MANYKRILALDLGESRIGVAVSDLLGVTAQGVGVIKRTNEKEDMDKIKAYVKEYDASHIILGHPINMDGSRGKRALITEKFYDKLNDNLDVKVKLWDERLTTKQAERALDEAGVNWRKKREVIDMMAAQLILSSYLDFGGLQIK